MAKLMAESMVGTGTESYQLLEQIHFSFLPPYRVAGMGEPWIAKMAETHAVLRTVGIGAILTLTEENLYGKDHLKAGFSVRHEAIDDGEAPSIEVLKRAVGFIDLSLNEGVGVAVHCLEGRGRTGTVLCAWLAATEQLDALSAISRLKNLRPYTALSLPQKQFLVEYLDR